MNYIYISIQEDCNKRLSVSNPLHLIDIDWLGKDSGLIFHLQLVQQHSE